MSATQQPRSLVPARFKRRSRLILGASSASGDMEAPLLNLVAVEKRYSGIKAVAGVSLSVNHGEFAAILGPNGAGKTTLLSVVAGEQRVSGGTIEYDGRDVTRLGAAGRARIGIARTFQVGRGFGNLTVSENIALVCEVARSRSWRLFNSLSSECRVDEVVGDLLEKVTLSHRGNTNVEDLTQAELKAVDLAMALALRPKLLLLDEPTAGVGSDEAHALVEMVRRIWETTPGLAVLLISHDLEVVFSVAQRIIFMRNGSVVFDGPPEEDQYSGRLRSLYLGEALS